jgi:integrase
MNSEGLVLRPSVPLSADLADLENAERLYEASRAENTRRTYKMAMKRFEAWCKSRAFEPFPTEMRVLGLYMSALEGEGKSYSLATLTISALKEKNAEGWEPSRGVKRILEGFQRMKAHKKQRKAPISPEELCRMVDSTERFRKTGLRDRAILLFGWFGAFRRSEICAMRVQDIEETPEGLRAFIVRSKTDQGARGQYVAILRGKQPYCAVSAVLEWLKAWPGGRDDPLFCSLHTVARPRNAPLCGHDIGRIVKKAAKKAGLDPSRVAGHSLRSGFATSAAREKQPLDAIMRQTRHHDANVLLRDYIRPASLFEGNATGPLGDAVARAGKRDEESP